jgi:H+-transporting ATPase
MMFLQLVAGGHLLLFVPRTDKWFFLPPHPARPLVIAIVLTQVLAVLMCGLGWLVPPIPWTLIGWVWLYNLLWLFALAGVRPAAEKLLAGGTARWQRSAQLVNEALQPQGATVTRP